MRLLAVAPEEAVMVGDSLGHDVGGARAVGMHAVWLRRSGALTPNGVGKTAEGVRVISSLDELPGLVAPPAAAGRTSG
jgi:FMN phosphatase YigB (HAD superfamily)